MMDFDSMWDSVGSGLAEILPTSPFSNVISTFQNIPYLGYLNWFFPVRACLTIFAAWLGALALYYLYSIVLRWIKVIA